MSNQAALAFPSPSVFWGLATEKTHTCCWGISFSFSKTAFFFFLAKVYLLESFAGPKITRHRPCFSEPQIKDGRDNPYLMDYLRAFQALSCGPGQAFVSR